MTCLKHGGAGFRQGNVSCKGCRDERAANRLIETAGGHYPGIAVSRTAFVTGQCRCDKCHEAATRYSTQIKRVKK